MRDYAAAARRFVAEDPIELSLEEERELVAIKMALYARALTLFEGALLLLENDRQHDFRIQSRGVIEATMCLIALDRNPAFVARMKDDDFKSRRSRLALHLGAKKFNGTGDVRQQLEEFVAQGLQGTTAIQLSTLLEGSDSIASTAAIETSRETPHMSALRPLTTLCRESNRRLSDPDHQPGTR